MKQRILRGLLVAGAFLGVPFATGSVILGEVEAFAGGTAGFGFTRGATVSRQLGGTGGASDGYLSISTPDAARFAARVLGGIPLSLAIVRRPG